MGQKAGAKKVGLLEALHMAGTLSIAILGFAVNSALCL
jgi:hypothetical protein